MGQSAMASRELPPSNPISEIPDLDIGLTSKRQPGRPRTDVGPPIAAQSPAYGLEGILDDDLLSTDFDPASLDIDVADPARHNAGASPAAVSRAWPHGKTPEPGSVEITPSQIEPLCTWGEKPTRWWETIIHAFLVYQGQRQLRDQVRPIERELSQAEARRDECLAHLAMTLRDSLQREGSLKSALQAAEVALAEKQHLTNEQRSAEATLASETQAMDQALTSAEADFESLKRQARQLQGEAEQAEITLKREQARLQRLGIERRNLEQAGPPGSPTSAHLAQIAEQAEALVPHIDLAQNSINSARAAMAVNATAIDETSSHIRELQHRRDLRGRSVTSQLRQVARAADGATERQRKALADLGRSILSAQGRIAVDDATLGEIARHDEAVATIWRRQQVYSLAFANFDSASAKRGARLAIAILGFLVAFIVWRLVR